jgi:peptidoglycan/LPS O-acetylase OafA/YrhL
MLIAAALSTALAALAFHLVERPAIAYSHRITGRDRARAPPEGEAAAHAAP